MKMIVMLFGLLLCSPVRMIAAEPAVQWQRPAAKVLREAPALSRSIDDVFEFTNELLQIERRANILSSSAARDAVILRRAIQAFKDFDAAIANDQVEKARAALKVIRDNERLLPQNEAGHVRRLRERCHNRLSRSLPSDVFSSSETLNRSSGLPPVTSLSKGTSAHGVVLRSLEKASYGRFVKHRVVRATVKRFADDFLTGARDPERYLKSDNPEHQQLIAKWLKASRDKRVFIGGSHQDLALVKRLSEELEKEGVVAFFYEFCRSSGRRELCDSKVVGAFFGSSGDSTWSHSPAAKASSYLPVELHAAQASMAGEEIWLMLTPSQVLALGAGSSISVTVLGK